MSKRLPRDEALEKEDRIDEMKKQQQEKKKEKKKTAHPSRTCCKHSRPLHYHKTTSEPERIVMVLQPALAGL